MTVKGVKLFRYCGVLLILAIAACQGTPPVPGMKLGNPYAVNGEMYYPKYEPDYDETGIASWYGPGFHGKYTACGEVFNQNDLTAAHPTLPMPSLVRVTNLSNGRSLIVRINDRGPFTGHRIIDLSKASARHLGILSTARVRVEYLPKETQEYLASIEGGGTRVINMAEYNETHPSSQIVENTDSSTHSGQIVDEAAPVLTVSSNNIETSAPNKLQHPAALIKSAWANDNKALSVADNDAAPGFNPPLSKADAPLQPAHAIQDAGYVVQVGSFIDKENAEKIASELHGMALLSIDKVDVGSKSWWRVRLGPFTDKESAVGMLDRVRSTGVTGAKIVHL